MPRRITYIGIYENDDFAGLAEFYGFIDKIHKISIGLRLAEKFWGRGIATKTVKAMVDYIYTNTDIEIIQASTLPANKGSAHVVEKLGFSLVVRNSDEDKRKIFSSSMQGLTFCLVIFWTIVYAIGYKFFNNLLHIFLLSFCDYHILHL